MKNLTTLITSLSLAIVLTTSVHADVFSSKLGTIHAHSSSSSASEDYARFAKFEWLNDADQSAVTVNHIVVSLADQRLYAYHGQQLVAWSNVSSGKTGHETPTGSFLVSEKDVDHHSSVYDNAPMPYFMRLTDYGVGLHAGILPGYAASHGCVRLPMGMARELYQHVESGTPVEIISATVASNVKPASDTDGVKLAQN